MSISIQSFFQKRERKRKRKEERMNKWNMGKREREEGGGIAQKLGL